MQYAVVAMLVNLSYFNGTHLTLHSAQTRLFTGIDVLTPADLIFH